MYKVINRWGIYSRNKVLQNAIRTAIGICQKNDEVRVVDGETGKIAALVSLVVKVYEPEEVKTDAR